MGLTRKYRVLIIFVFVLVIIPIRIEAKDDAASAGAAAAISLRGANGDFNVMNYGAKEGGKKDSSMAFIRAWRDACKSSGAARVVVPAGTFLTGEIAFAGPCTAKPVTIEIQGTMLSNPDMSMYTQNRWISVEHANNVVITGSGTLNGQGESSWQYADGDASTTDSSGGGSTLPDSLTLMNSNNTLVENIKLLNSKGFHMKVHGSSNVNLRNLTITAPGDSPNTDGVHISTSQFVNITTSKIGTGDDCISVGAGNSNITISKVQCGPGHGISVGSLGKRPEETDVKGVIVTNCTMTNTTNGVRIKSYRDSPSLIASDITFDDIIVQNVRNPIIIDQNYASIHKRKGSNVKISNVHFRNIRGTSVTNIGVALNCSNVVPCEGIELADIDLSFGGGPISSACQNAKPTATGKMNPAACKA